MGVGGTEFITAFGLLEKVFGNGGAGVAAALMLDR